jgi:PAS domain S-box-containing protein
MSVPDAAARHGQPDSGGTAFDAAMLDALLAQAPLGFAFIDTESRLRRVSDSLADMIGMKPPDQLGHTPAQVWPAAMAGTADAAVRKVLADGQPVVEGRSDGTRQGGTDDAGRSGCITLGSGRELALSWFPAHGADGALTGVTMIAEDVTGEQAAAAAMRQTTERYRSLVQAGNQVVWVTDPSGRVAEDSPEWRWVTGQSAEEYLTSGWLSAIHPDDRERTEREWRECVRTGTVFDGSYRVRTKSGSYRHYDVRAVPIEREGAIIEWMGASTDVTGQREADEMRGRLTEQLSAAALRTSRLQQATSQLAGELSVRGVVTVITEVGQSAIGADRSAVAVVRGDRLRLRIISAGSGEGAEEPSAEVPLDVPSVMTAAIATRRTVIADGPEGLRRIFEAEGQVEEFLGNSDEKAWIGLPLVTSGEPIGALLFSFLAPRQITDEERVFLEALAGQCALALERAQMYEREHTTAETLQRSLLPDKLPDVPGMALKARYLPVRPAGSGRSVRSAGRRGIEVGGDWYDAFRLPDGKLAVAAGDVMGKGLTAAAGMGRVRNALRALALTDPRPAAVLAGLDRLFLATELDEQVTTVCYLVVDPSTGEGVAGNAGHLPPLRLAPGRAPWLDPTEAGTPLGWASPRQQYPFSLPPGNTAVLYSDGLVENRKRGLDVGLAELVSIAAKAPPQIVADPGRLIDYLVADMLAGYEQDDDVTVLVLQMPEHRPDGSQGQAGQAERRRARS